MGGRLLSTTAVEWRLVSRTGIPAIALGLAGVWLVVASLVPFPWRSQTVALGLFVDLAGLGLLVVPALLVTERATGTEGLLRLTFQPGIERVLVRVAMSLAVGVAGGVVLVVASGVDATATRMAGVASMTVFFALCSWTVLGRGRTLTTYMARLPLVAVPLILPAILHHVGLWESALASVSPVTGQLSLVAGEQIGAGGWAWQVSWWALAALGAAAHQSTSHAMSLPTSAVRRRPPRPGPLHRLRSFLWVDRSVLLGDPLAVMVILGVPVTALVARIVSTVGVDWAEARFDIALDGATPLVIGLLVVVHTPVLVGSVAGLLMLEDRDAGMWPLVATTRSSFLGLLVYRCGLAAVASATLTAVGLGVAGAHHEAGAAGLAATALAAGVVAPVPALLMAALAHDRTAGVGVMKLLGVPFYLPLTLWWIEGPLRLPFGIVPTAWPLKAWWADTVPEAFVAALGAGLVTSAAGLTLWSRLRRRVT